MSHAQKLEAVYMYGEHEHFKDLTMSKKAEQLRNKVCLKLEDQVVVKDGEKLILDYYKNSMQTGDIICMPTDLFTRTKDTTAYVPVGGVDALKLFTALKRKPANLDVAGAWFEVIDPKPETRTKTKLSTNSHSHTGGMFVSAIQSRT